MSGYAAANYYKGGIKSLRAAEKQRRAEKRENEEVVNELSELIPDPDEWEAWWERVPEDASYREITALARVAIAERSPATLEMRFQVSLRHGG